MAIMSVCTCKTVARLILNRPDDSIGNFLRCSPSNKSSCSSDGHSFARDARTLLWGKF